MTDEAFLPKVIIGACVIPFSFSQWFDINGHVHMIQVSGFETLDY